MTEKEKDNNLSPEQKLSKLYEIYSLAFDYFKKNCKKDNNLQNIKEMSNLLKNQKLLKEENQLWKYSLTLVEPFDKCTTNIMEIILNSMSEILKRNLVSPEILQKMSEKLIFYIPRYFKTNEIDYKVDAKILKICELIYSNQNLFIHNENLKNIIKIYLRIYLSTQHIEQFQNQTQKNLLELIDKIVEKMKICNISNKYYYNNNVNIDLNQINIDNNTDIEKKKELLYKLQLNEFNFVTKKYMDFLIDLIEIQTKLNEKINDKEKEKEEEDKDEVNEEVKEDEIDKKEEKVVEDIKEEEKEIMKEKIEEKIGEKAEEKAEEKTEEKEIQKCIENYDIITKYINIIQNNSYNLEENQNKNILKQEIEKLNLSSLSLEYISEENNNILINNNKSYKIGKYGWCILCRKTADYWSDLLQFPLCSSEGCTCETEFNNCLQNIYPRSDFLNMLVYLSLTSTVGSADEYSNTSSEVLCRQFCLENIKEMIEKSYSYFKNDYDVIFIIKEIFKDSLLKNTLSTKIKIFQLSLELFISIISVYREHLKEQIEIFFMKVLITFLESENLGFVFKDAVLDALLQLVDDCSFLVEIYVNYDCDVNCTAVFCELINLLTKIMNGLYRKNKYQNTFKPLQENVLINKTLDFLNKFIFNLNTLVEKNEKINNKIKENITGSNKGLINISNSNTFTEENNNNINTNNTTESNLNSLNNNNNQNINQAQEDSSANLIFVKDKIAKNLRIKKLLEKAIEVFNISKSSGDCLKFLQTKKMIFGPQAFEKIKTTYINDINLNTVKNDYSYSSLLLPEEHTIISEMTSSSEEIAGISNIMQTPFISTINPLVYFITNEDKEKLPEIKCDDYIAFEMARFIKTNLKELKRERVGDYLCSGKPFNIQVLKYFIKSFDFKGTNILEAMRILFAELPLSGEAQVIDRVVQAFGEKFHKENPNELKNPDNCYYLAFSLLQLNTDLHREEVEKKMTLKEFISALNSTTGNDTIDPKYLENLYYKIQTDPLVIPGQKLSGLNKNKRELLHQERQKIMKSTFAKLINVNNNIISNNNYYVTNIDNDNIKQLLEFSWSNFFSIYSQLLADNDNEKIVRSCIENILIMARTCGILKLNTAEEAYINSIINMTNLTDNKEINAKNLESIQSLINFIINSGQYIRSGWLSILQIISKLDYYLMTDNEKLLTDIKYNRKIKYIEKEISLSLIKKEILSKNILDKYEYESLFSKTEDFDEDSIINFVTSLCEISKTELTDYYNPRVFSLHKLVEVAGFNIFRIQVQWVKIWKLISDHLVDVISNSSHENIWREALENLRQTVFTLLQKQDLSIYNFQMDFFKPFEIIFAQTKHTPTRGEMVIHYIYYIVGSLGRNIHSGWLVIFRILKAAFQRGDPKINEDIKNTLQKIYEDKTIINNVNPEVFHGYIECLCYMYLDKTLKQYAFETILNLLAKIMGDMDNEINSCSDNNNELLLVPGKSVLQLPNINKKFDFLKIFFYGFDDLISINVIEHLNLLFEIINHNKNLIFSKDCHSFLYMYYSYFKPHLIILLFSRYLNRFKLFENKENWKSFSKYKEDNSFETKVENIRMFLIESISELIKDFNSEEGKEYDKMFKDSEKKKNEHKRALVGFFREIKEGYTKNEMIDTIKKKLNDLSDLDERNYEVAIDFFLEKFKNMYNKIKIKFNEKEENENYLKYNYFYEDLFITIHQLLIVNNNSDLLLKIINKIISKDFINNDLIENKNESIEKINKNNLNILELISNMKIINNEEDLHKLIKFTSSFMSFLLSFMQENKSNDVNIIKEFKLITKIFYKILKIDLENKFDRYKIINSSSTVDTLIKLQGIQSNILQNFDSNDYFKLYENNESINVIQNLVKIYCKYKLNYEENSLINGVLLFELDNTLPKLIIFFDQYELKIIFDALIDFSDSVSQNLRKSSKLIMKQFMDLNLISFNRFNENKINNKINIDDDKNEKEDDINDDSKEENIDEIKKIEDDSDKN